MKANKFIFPFLLMTLFFCSVVNAEKSELIRSVTVSGTGSLNVPADRATIFIGIETTNKDAHQAEQDNAAIAKKIQDNLTSYGIKKDKMTTDHYSFYPVYNNDNGKRNVITGYTVNNAVAVTIDDLTKIGNIIDSSIRSGANKINAIQFSLKSTEELNKKALQLAVVNAKEKAQAMADALNKKIINVVTVNEQATMTSGARLNRLAMKSADTFAVATPIQSGNVDVTANIEITFEIH